jgi:hypothetical protein
MAGGEPEGGSRRGESGKGSRRAGPERRSGRERRTAEARQFPTAADTRLAERRSGLDRRRQHLHYDELTQHPRPERNINDYPLSTDEVEFINAINDYKEKFNRPFPTWSEVLHVLRTLGYLRADAPFPIPAQGGPFDPPAASEGAAGGTGGRPAGGAGGGEG